MTMATFPLVRVAVCAVLSLPFSQAFTQQQPVVSNVQVGQRAGTKLVDISYSLAYSGGPVTVWVDVSSDGGRSYLVPARTFSGHIGQGVSAGTNRAIVWDAEADYDGLLTEQMRVRINARGGVVPIPPPGMVLIPGGPFQMGEWLQGSSATTRTVYVSAFFMDRYEVTGGLWLGVRDWALQNGYDLSSSAGSWRALDHPVHSVDWHQAVKWCNARSEREGLMPVYYTNTAHSTVYRSGSVDLTSAMVKWHANGYRLPTEAEWEKAARGGLSGKAFPWGDTIDGSMANYAGVSHLWTNGDPRTTPVGYYNGGQQAGGSDMANGYGLYDVAGNIWEWHWDRSGGNHAEDNNPRGPDTGTGRLMGGGSWNNVILSDLRCTARNNSLPTVNHNAYGFRSVRGL